MKTLVQSLLAGAVLASAGSAAMAQDCPTDPVFVGVSAASSDVRASASRVDRGDWRVAEHFAREALESRTSSRNKAAASINLCAALANQGSDDTQAACDDAVVRNPGVWEAFTNRGAAFWLAGDLEAAAEDFATAADLGGNSEAILQNSALVSCQS